MPLSLEEVRARRSLGASALSRMVGQVDLPPIPAPDISNLKATVREPPALTEAELLEALRLEVLARLPRKARALGETLELGDWVTLDVIGFAKGVLLPELAEERKTGFLEPDLVVPGLGQALVGAAVGATVNTTVTLPMDYPVGTMQGALCAFSVVIRAAEAVAPPPPGTVEDPAFLQALGLPPNLDDTLDLVAETLEAVTTLEVERQATQQLLDQLFARAPVSIPEAAIDAVIGAEWNAEQGRFLLAMGATPQEREFAARAWLENGEIRDRTRRQIHTWLVVAAIARAHKLNEVEPTELEAYVRASAQAIGADPDQAVRELQEDRKSQQRTLDAYVWLRTLEFLQSRATLEVTAG